MSRSICIVAVVFLLAEVAWGQTCPEGEWCQWTVAEGGNGHWYKLTSPGDWPDAKAEAEQASGYLATINNEAENTWVWETFCTPETSIWIGFYQDSQDPDYSEPDHGWKWTQDPELCRWVTGNPDVCYTNWDTGHGEPNNYANDQYGGIYCSGVYASEWNDFYADYFVLQGS